MYRIGMRTSTISGKRYNEYRIDSIFYVELNVEILKIGNQ